MNEYLPKLSESNKRWLRFAALVAGLALLCWIASILRSVFTPLLVGAAIAYVLNPLVTWFEKTRGVQRLHTVIVTFGIFGALVIGGGFYLGSKTIAQLQQLEQNIPAYSVALGEWIDELRTTTPNDDMLDEEAAASVESGDGAGEPSTSAPITSVADSPAAESSGPDAAGDDWWSMTRPLLAEHGTSVARSILGYSIAALSNVANLVSLLVLIPMYTFFILWRFNDVTKLLHDYLPTQFRATVVHLVRTIDSAVANFFRGRLLVCIGVGTLTGIGWSIAGVPYSLPLGVLAGTLNLVPFMSLLALPPALLFAYLGASEAGQPWAVPLVMAMGVYVIVQALESFVLSPYIEGRSSGLHPLAIVIAILIGAQLGGLLGMLLAIPVASTLKTLCIEMVRPELRRLAGWPSGEDATGPAADPPATG